MDNDNQKLKPIFANRLLLLADFLETLPKEKFNYARWFTNIDVDKNLNACGTTACALGWATAIPEFQNLGLYIRYDRNYLHYSVALRDSSADMNAWETACQATEKVFGLTPEQTDYLFIPDEDGDYNEDGIWVPGDSSKLPKDASAIEVANRIRAFVSLNG